METIPHIRMQQSQLATIIKKVKGLPVNTDWASPKHCRTKLSHWPFIDIEKNKTNNVKESDDFAGIDSCDHMMKIRRKAMQTKSNFWNLPEKSRSRNSDWWTAHWTETPAACHSALPDCSVLGLQYRRNREKCACKCVKGSRENNPADINATFKASCKMISHHQKQYE